MGIGLILSVVATASPPLDGISFAVAPGKLYLLLAEARDEGCSDVSASDRHFTVFQPPKRAKISLADRIGIEASPSSLAVEGDPRVETATGFADVKSRGPQGQRSAHKIRYLEDKSQNLNSLRIK